MTKDPIVEEVRAARQRYAAKYGNDVQRIMNAARKAQAVSKRKVCNFDTRPARPDALVHA